MFCHAAVESKARFAGLPGDVGRDMAVFRTQKGIFGADGFFGKHVEIGARQPAAVQRVRERVFVYQPAAGGVDEYGRRLHQRQRLAVDDVQRVGALRAMQGR